MNTIACPSRRSVFEVSVDTRPSAHVSCPACRTWLKIVQQTPNPRTGVTFCDVLFGIGVACGVVGGGTAIYKMVQAATDEVFEAVEFPASFRSGLIHDHVAKHGSWCPECDHLVDPADLTVDHIVSLRNGGLTSRRNATVMCRSCNSSKGAQNTVLDYVRGRSG